MRKKTTSTITSASRKGFAAAPMPPCRAHVVAPYAALWTHPPVQQPGLFRVAGAVTISRAHVVTPYAALRTHPPVQQPGLFRVAGAVTISFLFCFVFSCSSARRVSRAISRREITLSFAVYVMVAPPCAVWHNTAQRSGFWGLFGLRYRREHTLYLVLFFVISQVLMTPVSLSGLR